MHGYPASLTVAAVLMFLASIPAASQDSGPSPVTVLAQWGGGSVGSAAGYSAAFLVTRPDRCGDDPGCILPALAANAASAAVGSWAGVMLVGRATETNPSGWGAALGSVGGAAAGAGVLVALQEIRREDLQGGTALLVFSVTHGLLSALGERVVNALR